MGSTPFGRLRFLYVGSSDVRRDLDYYVKVLGSRKVWDHTAFGTRVAAVELCDGPLLLLAGHRPAPSVLPVFQVESLKVSERELRSRGWKPEGLRIEIPNGPCFVFKDPSGNQLALFQDARPGML
jgi:catechol 2,3-dioxygenase-like lactoylglutathione lyase family enzyme